MPAVEGEDDEAGVLLGGEDGVTLGDVEVALEELSIDDAVSGFSFASPALDMSELLALSEF